jgi:hypothetical protein
MNRYEYHAMTGRDKVRYGKEGELLDAIDEYRKKLITQFYELYRCWECGVKSVKVCFVILTDKA